MRRSIPNHNHQRFTDGFYANRWNVAGNIIFMLTMWTFFKRDRLRRALYRTVPRKFINWYVWSIFLMIAHDGTSSFLQKWLWGKDPALNCDA
jgi:hypothetical protein